MDELEMVEEALPEPEAQPFSQRVEEPAVESEPEPRQVETTPEPEPEAPPVEPEWLQGPPIPQEQYQQQQYGYQPQYQQQYEQPQQRRQQQGGSLDRFLEDPDGFIDQILSSRLAEVGAPMQQQMMMTQHQLQAIRDTFTNNALQQADQAIRGAYKHLNSDSAFRSNKRVQQRIESTLKGMREQALSQARMGNFGPLSQLAGLGETHIKAALAAARVVEGVASAGAGPLNIEGATVESSRAPASTAEVQLTEDQKEIARRLGPKYESKLRKGIADAKKYNDFEG